MRPHLLERLNGDFRLFFAVVGDPDVQRFAAFDNIVQRLHRLLDGRFGIGAVVVEYIHVVQMHTL